MINRRIGFIRGLQLKIRAATRPPSAMSSSKSSCGESPAFAVHATLVRYSPLGLRVSVSRILLSVTTDSALLDLIQFTAPGPLRSLSMPTFQSPKTQRSPCPNARACSGSVTGSRHPHVFMALPSASRLAAYINPMDHGLYLSIGRDRFREKTPLFLWHQRSRHRTLAPHRRRR